MIIYLCIKFQSNTPILSKDIARNQKCYVREGWDGQDGWTGRMDGTDVRMDSGDTICPPTENGGGIKTDFQMDTIAAILDRNYLSYFFLSTKHPDASYKVSSHLAFHFKRRSEDRLSRWPP